MKKAYVFYGLRRFEGSANVLKKTYAFFKEIMGREIHKIIIGFSLKAPKDFLIKRISVDDPWNCKTRE